MKNKRIEELEAELARERRDRTSMDSAIVNDMDGLQNQVNGNARIANQRHEHYRRGLSPWHT